MRLHRIASSEVKRSWKVLHPHACGPLAFHKRLGSEDDDVRALVKAVLGIRRKLWLLRAHVCLVYLAEEV